VSELRVSFNEILPVKEAVRRLPRALDQLDSRETEHLVITRRNQPRAVLISLERYEMLLRAAAAPIP
jgi:PHD/YefM family antitoxin component YafN of YafNO toxin-antitoxin module